MNVQALQKQNLISVLIWFSTFQGMCVRQTGEKYQIEFSNQQNPQSHSTSTRNPNRTLKI